MSSYSILLFRFPCFAHARRPRTSRTTHAGCALVRCGLAAGESGPDFFLRFRSLPLTSIPRPHVSSPAALALLRTLPCSRRRPIRRRCRQPPTVLPHARVSRRRWSCRGTPRRTRSPTAPAAASSSAASMRPSMHGPTRTMPTPPPSPASPPTVSGLPPSMPQDVSASGAATATASSRLSFAPSPATSTTSIGPPLSCSHHKLATREDSCHRRSSSLLKSSYHLFRCWAGMESGPIRTWN
jgi:hypothetical protein